jgi:hypothetical protein
MAAEVVPVDIAEMIGDEIRPERQQLRAERQQSKGSGEPKCLLSDSVRRIDGFGPAVDLGDSRGKLLVVTLGVNAVVERTGLTVSVWGSADQVEWGTKPLISLRQRQYCGVYSVLLNLAHHPDIRCLRVEWNISRLGKGERDAQFGFQVFVEESGARVHSSACA